MRPAIIVTLLSSALAVTSLGQAEAKMRMRSYYAPALGSYRAPAFQGRSAWVAGRTPAGAACTIYSCPYTFAPGTPLNPEGNIRPGGIP